MRPVITTNTDDHIGLAVIRSLGKNNIPFQVVSKTNKTLAWYSRYCSNNTIAQYDLDYFSKLSKNDIVFPMIVDTMMMLQKNKSRLSCQLGFSDYETLNAASNKGLLTRHALQQNIPCPRTFFITSQNDLNESINSIDYPAILKPCQANGGKGIRTVHSSEQMLAFAEYYFREFGSFLLQEKVPFTTKYTVGALCNTEGDLKRVCVIKELRNYPVETGPACYVETVDYPELIKYAQKILKSLRYFGIADIDFILDRRDNTPKLMEINPRFWGSMQVAINAGVDFPALLYQILTEGDIDTNLTYKTGMRCRHLLFNDMVRMIDVLRNVYPGIYKWDTVRDFFTFRNSDKYYVYSTDDILPVWGALKIKVQRRIRSHGR